MRDDDINWDKEFADDPEWNAIEPTQRDRLLAIMEKMIDMGMAAIYGDEDDDVPDAEVDCARCVSHCRAKCCTMIFALTKDEVDVGDIAYNKQRPFFIARDEDGYCPHMDRETYACLVWQNRPLRCRRYDCRDDKNVWPDGVPP
ncbi:MAG: YkgJ family cysteine cluster protein [Thioalkalispiraceae bacterium]|jgi:uncharacterized protein YuzB (UPF0349 family)